MGELRSSERVTRCTALYTSSRAPFLLSIVLFFDLEFLKFGYLTNISIDEQGYFFYEASNCKLSGAVMLILEYLIGENFEAVHFSEATEEVVKVKY